MANRCIDGVELYDMQIHLKKERRCSLSAINIKTASTVWESLYLAQAWHSFGLSTLQPDLQSSQH